MEQVASITPPLITFFTSLAATNGAVSVNNGVVHFDDGKSFDLGEALTAESTLTALSEEELLGLGYTVSDDPVNPSMFRWSTDIESCKNSFPTKEAAFTDATRRAKETLFLHRCDDCGKLHTDETLKDVKHLWERVQAGSLMPSGECDCGALCYPL